MYTYGYVNKMIYHTYTYIYINICTYLSLTELLVQGARHESVAHRPPQHVFNWRRHSAACPLMLCERRKHLPRREG